MNNLIYPKKIIGYNNQFSLQIPVDIPRGLGWSTQSKKQHIRVRLTPFPEQGGFFVQSELHRPVDDIRFLVANLKKKKENNVNSWERTLDVMRNLKSIPNDLASNHNFEELYNQREKIITQMAKLINEVQPKLDQLMLTKDSIEQNMANIANENWNPITIISNDKMSGRTHQGNKAFIE